MDLIELRNVFEKASKKYYNDELKKKAYSQYSEVQRVLGEFKSLLRNPIVDETVIDKDFILQELSSLIEIKRLIYANIHHKLLEDLLEHKEITNILDQVEPAIKEQERCVKCKGLGGYSVPNIIDHDWVTCSSCNGSRKNIYKDNSLKCIELLCNSEWGHELFLKTYEKYLEKKEIM